MANEDSFINEVSEEVRRERLFGYIRRYGWIAVLAILLLVGGAAFNEWRKAQARAEAEARGDAILAALEAPSAEARASTLSAIGGTDETAAVIAMLAAGQAAEGEGTAAALDRLRAIAEDPEIDPIYRDLAALKAVLIEAPDLDPATQIERLQPLTLPGAPYSVLALEATALAHVAAGDTEAALSILTDLMSDSAASQGLRRRASQLIVALGGSLDAG